MLRPLSTGKGQPSQILSCLDDFPFGVRVGGRPLHPGRARTPPWRQSKPPKGPIRGLFVAELLFMGESRLGWGEHRQPYVLCFSGPSPELPGTLFELSMKGIFTKQILPLHEVTRYLLGINIFNF